MTALRLLRRRPPRTPPGSHLEEALEAEAGLKQRGEKKRGFRVELTNPACLFKFLLVLFVSFFFRSFTTVEQSFKRGSGCLGLLSNVF